MGTDNLSQVIFVAIPAIAIGVTVMLIVGRLRGVQLRQKFIYLGELRGRTLEEITREVGSPSSRTALTGNAELFQWARPGYHIALIFSDGTCQGVQHESVT